MRIYRHTQRGTALVWLLLGSGLVAAAAAVRAREGGWIVGAVVAVLVASSLLFASLTVEVADAQLSLAFGPGLIRRRWSVGEIADLRAVRNPWWYGWGIHLTPRGWLFNVAGLDAIEVTFRDGRTVRIGTDEPQDLIRALREAMMQRTGESR